MFDAARETFRRWGERPAALFALLVFLCALTRPYLGLVHDAMLYSGQVLLQLDPETYRDDLFFRHGSQDAFSVFSRVAAPLAGAIGVKAAFATLYALTLLGWIGGSQRLMTRLFAPEIAVPALIALVTHGPQYGACGTFQVHEAFLTPRLVAFALALWGLDAALARRPWTALALLGAATAFHPLLGVPAAGVALVYLLTAHLSLGAVCVLAGAGLAASAAVLEWGPTHWIPGPRYDAEWRAVVDASSPNLVPNGWSGEDWLRVAAGLALVAGAGVATSGRTRRFVVAVALVGVAGAVQGAVVSRHDYALPIMAQPYRATWLAAWLVPAALFAVAWPLVTHRSIGAAALGVGALAGFGATSLPPSFALALGAAAGGVTLATGRRERVLFGVTLALAAQFLATTGLLVFAGNPPSLMVHYFALAHASPALVLAALLARGPRPVSPTVGRALGVGGALLAGLAFALPFVPAYRDRTSPLGSAASVVGDELRRAGAKSVYSNLSRLDLVWVEWGARNYFDWFQTGGLLFHRGTALDAKERTDRIRPFEFARMRQDDSRPDSPAFRFFGVARADDVPPPTCADLERLFRETDVDFAVLIETDLPGARLRVGPVAVYARADVLVGRSASNSARP